MVKANISEAANRLNLSVDSIRRRLKAGAISGERDARGQWWVDLDEDAQPIEQPADHRLAVGLATPLQRREASDELIDALHAQIEDLRTRLDRSEAERREDKEKALAERQSLIALVERLASQGARNS
jgi:hypothetical protein